MNRQQKETTVANFTELFDKAQASFLVKYKGINVSELQSLRGGLRENDGTLKVTKARLMKIAMKDVAGSEGFTEHLSDQVGLVFAFGEVPVIAKKLSEFAKENESFAIITGLFEDKVLDKDQIKFLATLPSRDVLFAKLMGTMQAPVTRLASTLHLSIARLLHVLQEAAAKGGAQG